MAGDGSDRALWLTQIQRIARNGEITITVPPVTFGGVQLANRVDDNGDGSPPYFRYRISQITTESGQGIGVSYLPTECSKADPVNMPANPETNDKRCYPVLIEVRDPANPTAPPTYKTDWFHKHVVSRVTEENPEADSVNKETNYEYVGTPAWAFDDDTELVRPAGRTWNQWRGYSRVRTLVGKADEDAPSVVENLYFRGMDGDRLPGGAKRDVDIVDSEGGVMADEELFSGQVRETLYHNGVGGPLTSATLYTPWLHGPTATRARDDMEPQKAYVQQTTRVASRTLLSDNRGWRRTAVENTFDNLGRQTLSSDLGDLSTPDDDICTRITYAPIAAKHIMTIQGRVETVSKACTVGTLTPEDVLGDQLATYDGVGNMTEARILDHFDGTTPVYALVGTVTFDNYGRPLVTTDVYNTTTTNTYTPAAGEIPSRVTTSNHLGHTTTLDVDPARGLPLSQTDANGRKTVLQYDALGRNTKVWTPDRDPNTKSPDAEFSYDVRPDGPVVVTTRKLRENGTYSTTYDIYDAMLRHRQTQSEALGGGRVLSSTFYNSRGEIVKQHGAHFNSDAPAPVLWSSHETAVPSSTRTVYDPMGRPTDSIAFKYGTETWRTVNTYGGDWTAVDPPEGEIATRSSVDARGNKTELRQYHGGSPTGPYDTTTYTYDKRGSLTGVVDPSGNTWTYEYDVKGRNTRTVDPDRGETTMTYDVGDRLLTTTDDRNRTIAYAYDVLGRQTATHEGSLNGPKLTEQTYDTLPGALGLPVSSIRYVGTDAYVTSVTGYNTEYQPTGTKITIPAVEGALAGDYTYTSGYTPNTGMPSWTQHPNVGGLGSERVANAYNGFDLPDRVTRAGQTVISKTTYSELGRVLSVEAGPNGRQIWSAYTYDQQTGRLLQVANTRSVLPQAINTTSYDYDDAGNILKVTDAQGAAAGTPVVDTQCFAYDHLRRMTHAWTATDDCAAQPGGTANGGNPQVGGPDPYWTSYTFDKAGNRLTEVQHSPTGDTLQDVTRTYTYPEGPDGVRSHKLLSVTTAGPGGSRVDNYTYDEVGNTATRTIQGDTQNLEWDAEGHLSKVTEAGIATEYVYDAGGNRIIRRDAQAVTLYLPGTELKLNKATNAVTGTRYYSGAAGPTLVRTNESGTMTASWLLGDNNGTANTAVADTAQQTVTRRKFTPYGDVRGTAPSVWPGEKGYVGGTVDASTGLVHLGAREYDPAIGRFISVDPLMDNTESQTMHGYAYANNSPVTYSDPSGLFADGCYGDYCWGSMPDGWDAPDAGPPPAGPPPTPPVSSVSQADVERARFLANQNKLELAAKVALEVLKDMSGFND